jgi:hypothetical protein
MTWKRAEYAATASEEAKLVCCGRLNCFGGEGCDPARWWTKRMEDKGYRLTRKPYLITPEEPPCPAA